jgi:hypothetical protein
MYVILKFGLKGCKLVKNTGIDYNSVADFIS